MRLTAPSISFKLTLSRVPSYVCAYVQVIESQFDLGFAPEGVLDNETALIQVK